MGEARACGFAIVTHLGVVQVDGGCFSVRGRFLYYSPHGGLSCSDADLGPLAGLVSPLSAPTPIALTEVAERLCPRAAGGAEDVGGADTNLPVTHDEAV